MPHERSQGRPTGAEPIVQHFGYWPTFHDSEVLSLTLERDRGRGEHGPTIIIKLHAFETAPGPKRSVPGPRTKHCTITLAFYDARIEKIEAFNARNTIQGMSIVDVRSGRSHRFSMAVKIHGAKGLNCSFQCGSGEVVDFKPVTPAGEAQVEAPRAERETA